MEVIINFIRSVSKSLEFQTYDNDVLGLNLFSLIRDAMLGKLETLPGFIIDGRNVKTIRYTDDTVLMAYSEKKQQDLINGVANE